MKNRYRLQSKYPISYKNLEDALEDYAQNNELSGYKYQTGSGKYKYNAIANHVIDFCNECFNYIDSPINRVEYFLQGVGLNIPIYNSEIYEVLYKEGRLLKTDSDNRHLDFLNRYWRFMAMRLQNIASSKN